MIIESVIPSPCIYPTAPEITAAIISTIIIKSLNCSKNFINKGVFLADFSSFKPYSAFLLFTSSSKSPTVLLDSNFFSTSSVDKLNQFFINNPFLSQ